jgi:hypothetical protein
MNDEQRRVLEEELRAVVASSQERRKALEELIINAELTVTRARLAVARCRRLWAQIEMRQAGMRAFNPTRST